MESKDTLTGLRANCLGFSGVTAMAIALISPTMTAALIIPLMYSNAGNASWLAYLFGTVMLLFVALNLNQFARRSTSAGSMYGYSVMGLGTTTGNIAGWCLIWAYLFIGTAGMTGFTIFASTLLEMAGIQVPQMALFIVCAGSIWCLGYKDIRLSSGLMLVIEGLSVALILLLCSIVLFGQKSIFDTKQLTLQGASFSGISLGVVVAIFSLVGFECATAFGEEARNPLQTIPRAVIVSLLLTGVFFVFVTYSEVLGFTGYKTTLDKIDAPLNVLSDMMKVGWLKVPISAGAMLSFYSLALSCMNSGARILYPMGRLGVFHRAIGNSHDHNETPHVAVTRDGNPYFPVGDNFDDRVQTSHSRRFQRRRHFRRVWIPWSLLPDFPRGTGLSEESRYIAWTRQSTFGGLRSFIAGSRSWQRLSGAVVASKHVPIRLRGISVDRYRVVHDPTPPNWIYGAGAANDLCRSCSVSAGSGDSAQTRAIEHASGVKQRRKKSAYDTNSVQH